MDDRANLEVERQRLAEKKSQAFNVLVEKETFEIVRAIFRAADRYADPGLYEGKFCDFAKRHQGIEDVTVVFDRYNPYIVEALKIKFCDGDVLELSHQFSLRVSLNSETVLEASGIPNRSKLEQGKIRTGLTPNKDDIRAVDLSLLPFDKLKEVNMAFSEAEAMIQKAKEEREREHISRQDEAISLGEFGNTSPSSAHATPKSLTPAENPESNEFLVMGFWPFALVCTLVVSLFPLSLAFCVYFIGLDRTILLLKAMAHDAIHTIVVVLGALVAIVFIFGLIVAIAL